MPFQIREILSEIRHKEVIAKGASVKIRKRLDKLYGHGNWKKMKGIAKVQTSLHQKYSISKISWEYSCFRQKNVFSDHNWTLLISGPTVISGSYLPNRSVEHYLRRGNVHFLALKTDGNNEV